MGLSAYRLAKDINVPLNRIAGILAGKRAITADTALRLARYFGTGAQSWINLQAQYDLAVTRQASGWRIDREVSREPPDKGHRGEKPPLSEYPAVLKFGVISIREEVFP